MAPTTREEWNEVCRRMRLDLLAMAHQSGTMGAHIGPGLSLIEIVAVLHLAVMRHEGPDRDHFVLSKGHGGIGYYTALHQAGLITREQLLSFEHEGGPLPGQPSKDMALGIEYSSGTLGLGLSYGIGLALSDRRKGSRGRTFVLLGDGECSEGSVWEGAMLAAAQRLDNLAAVVDMNGMQSDGPTEQVLPCDLASIWKGFGWKVSTVDGHDEQALLEALQAPHPGVPQVVLARTVKGKGISFMENDIAWHHNRLTDANYQKAIAELSLPAEAVGARSVEA